MVTYTSISSDDGSLDVGSPEDFVYGCDGLPMMPEDPYAYVEATMQEPPPPDFVPEPVYLEFIPPEDDVLPAEEQPLPATISPTADSPGYIIESDPEEDPKEEDDEDPEEDPADYPTEKDDDDEEESSGDDADDEEEDEGEDEEEHLALADFVPPPAYRTTARMSIRAQTPIPFTSEHLDQRHHHFYLSLPTSSPPLLLPSDYGADVLEVTLPPRKRFCIALGPRFKVEECSPAPTGGFRAYYGFVGTLDAKIRRDPDKEIGVFGWILKHNLTNDWLHVVILINYMLSAEVIILESDYDSPHIMNSDDTWEPRENVTKKTSKSVSVKGSKRSTSKKVSCSKSTKTKPFKDLKFFDDSSLDDQGNVFRGKPKRTSVYSKGNKHLVSKKRSCSKKGSCSKGVVRGKPVASDVELKVVSVPYAIDAKRPPQVKNCILRLASSRTWQKIMQNDFGIKMPTNMLL
uniref:Uncharacterized protein n=1 Tax=Tanacetum cinerariifolium TaxID=118510 RepID=A0A6L2KQC2_TANCI|nr:hypothetical protein [Tanacetum cinerariifolium]